MSEQLLKKYERYCDRTVADLLSLRNHTTESLQQQWIPEKWTMIQLIDHLLTIEKAVLAYISKKNQEPELKTVKFRNRLYAFLTGVYLGSGKKFKAPAVLPQPVNDKDLDRMLREFEIVRTKMRSFVEAWPGENTNKLIFKHPVAGMFTLGQTISFLNQHWQHHAVQRKELLGQLK
ncbi:MAG: DinB family protein [Bacteroidota bacterium]